MSHGPRDVLIIKPSHRRATVPSSIEMLEPQPLGSLEEVKATLAETLPNSTWLDAWAGIADGDDWTAEISIRVARPVREISLRITGEAWFAAVKTLCDRTDWRAIDLDTWSFVA